MSYINELASSLGTYLYGRKMYETMVYWETAHEQPDMTQVALTWADQWKAAEKIVFSKTLTEIRSERTRIERDFDAEKIRQLKAESPHDISVDGTELAAVAIKAGLVDEIHQIICPVLVGGGKRFYPDGVKLDLKLFDERHFDSGVVILKYAVLNK
ncbi:dihydrofolate reductase family protein [Dyadobacter sp. CY343]|uniref:dihydrofolate reductase family protein n=1 Tax=Dyadobacter sp. CY343 TaxID=2907299 RepID=UPI001F20FF08|nr:dihydrofolate reductase family protein [Dyadobacter sp. CY343]MCE7062129.1 dihydrofolate reductase family protein [Dyadobacter sp. CY343]